MTGLWIVLTALLALVVGGAIGFVIGERMDSGNDFPIAPLFTGPLGAAIGAVVGVIAGTAIFL